ncbi:uncharacterized protein FIBRA_01935 [Fibroporia radiculosa]|uniref:glutathione transferase n=1 Tax=Fibroporia radiculosa TaxID=599839 RepID=J4GLW7_9APHY|nr:uncharacterized protein FIBRA_01935 [Fibroporia radiculosa]CCL99910.1 predicted protein [Fibroporia radiculosa]
MSIPTRDGELTASNASLQRTPSFIQFAPKRAMASFENLVVLANYEERLREARKIVWRDRGEKPVELVDVRECFLHAAKGGLRSGGLAFAIRAGVNLILLLTRIKKIPRDHRFALIRHAAFGPDSFRFAAMLGSFVAVYKFILNALPVLLPHSSPPVRRSSTHHTRSRTLLQASLRPSAYASPFDSPFSGEELDESLSEDIEMATPEVLRGSRHARLSMSAQAHQVWVWRRTRQWHAILAGALAGAIAIMFEKRGRRVAIAQQLFVRGLQGSCNALSSKHGFRIPHGDVLVFSLSCGQIMYAWFFRPETLPRSYDTWIASASKVHLETLAIHRDLVRDGVFKVQDMQKLLATDSVTPLARADMLSRVALASAPPPEQYFGPPFVPCSALHPWFDSCTLTQLDRLVSVFRWMLPIYGALHFIPMLLFRRQRVFRDPLRMLLRAALGSARSSAFLGVFVLIYQSCFCLNHNLYNDLIALRKSVSPSFLSSLAKLLPLPLVNALVARKSYYVYGILAGLSLFVEEKRRREELAMYVLPKGLESAWLTARGRGWVGRTGRWGEVLLTSVGMGMVMSIYQASVDALPDIKEGILLNKGDPSPHPLTAFYKHAVMSHGKQFTLYSHTGGPNGWKVVFVLKELGLEYETIYLDLVKGEQKAPGFTKYNPNGRIPALIDHGNNDFVVWESCAILVYLVEKYDPTHKISPVDAGEKITQLQWLFFQASGQGPYFGQVVTFQLFHSEKIPSAIERYQKEVIRVLGVLESVLSKQEWLVGGKYTIADLSFIPWNTRVESLVESYEGFNFEKDFPAVYKWHNAILSRKAVSDALAEKEALTAAK